MQQDLDSGHLVGLPGERTVSTRDVAGMLLSRFLCESRARSAPRSHNVCRAAAFFGTTSIVHEGTQLPPRFPELPLGPWPTGEWAIEQLGVTSRQLQDRFVALEFQHGSLAALEDDEVRAFFPDEIVEVVAQMIEDGPGLASHVAARAVHRYSQTVVPANKRLPERNPSSGTVASFRDTFTRLFRIAVDLSNAQVRCEALQRWTTVPRVPLPRRSGPAVAINRDGPPIRKVRLATGTLTRTVHALLGKEPGETELAALNRMSDTDVQRLPLFRPMRLRLAVFLILLTGGRVFEVADLRVSSYRREYQGRAPDYLCGPAFDLYPQKKREEIVSTKLVPPEMGDMTEAYLACLYRKNEIVRRQQSRANRPNAKPAIAPPEDHALLVADVRGFVPWRAHGIRTALSGLKPYARSSGRPSSGCRPVIRDESCVNPELSEAEREYVGYPPHTWRHTASQAAERAGALYNERHKHAGVLHPPPPVYAAALLDHGSPEPKMRAIYGDRYTEGQMEAIAARAIDGIWRLLTGRDGARLEPDLEAIRDETRLLNLLRRQLDYKREERRRIQASASRRSGERTVAQLEGTILKLGAVSAEIDRTIEQIAASEARISALREDESTWVEIPDEAERKPRTLEAVDAELGSDPPPQERTPVRNPPWVTVTEFADATETVRSTVSRWANGTHLPPRAQNRPWEPGRVPIDDSQGLKYRRILLDHLNPEFLEGSPTIARRLEELQFDWPAPQMWRDRGRPGPRCFAPIVLPEWLKAEQRDE